MIYYLIPTFSANSKYFKIRITLKEAHNSSSRTMQIHTLPKTESTNLILASISSKPTAIKMKHVGPESWMRDTWMGHSRRYPSMRATLPSGGSRLPARRRTKNMHDGPPLTVTAYARHGSSSARNRLFGMAEKVASVVVKTNERFFEHNMLHLKAKSYYDRFRFRTLSGFSDATACVGTLPLPRTSTN